MDLIRLKLGQMKAVHAVLKKRGLTSRLISMPSDPPVQLKLECELPTGSYKIRGVVSYFLEMAERSTPEISVLSAGNLALATALECRDREIRCRAIVPRGISDAKKQGLIRLGAEVDEHPFDAIWEMVKSVEMQECSGFLHPFHPRLLLGYSTIALELGSQLKNSDGIIVPYGLGGLTLSILAGLKALGSRIPVYLCEIKGHAPFSQALDAGCSVEGATLNSFIEALGTPEVLPNVFEHLRHRISGVVQVTEEEVRRAMRILHDQAGIRVEGAAGAAYACAQKLSDKGLKNVVALLTGRNILDSVFEGILNETSGSI